MSDALYELHQKFGRLESTTEQQYQQVLTWAKEQIAQQQQQIAKLTSRLDELEKT